MAERQDRHTGVGRAWWLSLIGALLIAGVLQFAAAAKVASGAQDLQLLRQAKIAEQVGREPDVTVDDFQWLIRPGGMVESGVLLDFVLAFAEFGVVVLLLLLHRGRVMWGVTTLMFGGFFGYAVFRLMQGQPCGCFGTLWQPPEWFSVTIDGVFVVLGLALLAIRRTSIPVLGVVLGLTLACAVTGYFYARATDPRVTVAPTPAPVVDRGGGVPRDPVEVEVVDSSLLPEERLLRSELLAEIRGLTESEPGLGVYLFLWSPTCATCQAMKPTIDYFQEQYDAEENPVLRVRSIRKGTIASRLGIQDHEWPTSPAILIIQDGQVVAMFGGDGSPLPNQVFEAIMAGEPLEDLAP
ncbi:MAG: thioredoxin [Phycisphaeraceae bacterium]|nr:MAG: thioredoxin [Phycisphaeraceae bacterium]